MAFLLTVREGPSKWPVGSEDKPTSHFRKELAPLRLPTSMQAHLAILEYHAHMSTIYTDISIYDLYINIYTYISIACTCRPRSLGLAQLWEARRSPGRASGKFYEEQKEILQQHWGGGRW